MKCIKVDLPVEHNTIEIIPFYDLHIGSSKCVYSLINERINYVAKTPNAYAILGGDIINNSTVDSVASATVYTEPFTPTQQIYKAKEMFEPIKDKIIGVTTGNHCRRDMKSGIDLMHLFCSELGIENKYDYVSCLLFIRFGNAKWRDRKKLYTLYMTHGDGTNGRTVGAKANGLARRGEIVDADIIVAGHTHQGISFRQSVYRVDARNNSVSLKEQVFVNTGATLGYEEYAEIIGMRPSSVHNPSILLDGHEHKIVVIN